MNVTTRRRFLAAVAAGSGVGLAGCGTASCSEGERLSPATVVEPASEPTAGGAPGDANWAMHGRDPGNTSYTPGLSAGGLEHRFTVDLRGSPATATPTANAATESAESGSGPAGGVWPVAVGDRVYVAGAGGVRALRAADGSEVWATAEAEPTHPPAVDGTSVYATSDDALVALDRADGTVRWQYGDGTGFSPPVSAGGTVFLTGEDRLHALDPGDGTRRWVAETGSGAGRPAVTDRAVHATAEYGDVRAFDPGDGSRLWEQNLGIASVGVHGTARPPVVREGTVVVPGEDEIPALDGGTGEVRWRWEHEGYGALGTVAAGPDRLFVKMENTLGSDDELFAVDLDGPEARWCRVGSAAHRHTTPVAGPDHAVVHFGNRVVAFDAADGTSPWAFGGYAGEAVSTVVAGGSLYVGTDAGVLYGLTTT